MTETTSTLAPAAEITRHSAYTRWLHWLMALGFIVAVVTGLSLYWSSILKWTYPLMGGKPFVRELHFWAGIEFVAVFILEFFDWMGKIRWRPADSEFIRRLKEFALQPDLPPPAETGFFNGGQKLYFWSVAVSAALFLLTGLVWRFRGHMPHDFYAVCRTSHRVLGVAMSGMMLVHIYKATLAEPGTFRSMIRGTVTSDWAQRRRPGWAKENGR